MLDHRDDNRIERLKRSLYSRDHAPKVNDERSPITREEVEVKDAWLGKEQAEAASSAFPSVDPQKKSKFFKRVLLAAVIFFTLSTGVALFIFFGGLNIISTNNIDILVSSPLVVGGGEEMPITVTVNNKNNVDLLNAVLVIEYPEGSRAPGDLSSDAPRFRESIEHIGSGQSVSRSASVVLFGQENERKTIRVSIEYEVPGSETRFSKEKEYDIALGASPISVAVQAPREVTSNQEFKLIIDVTSNARTPLFGLALKVDFPFGFYYKDAIPEPAEKGNIWFIEKLEPGEKKTYTVTGRIEGQNGEERAFRYTVGIPDPVDDTSIRTAFNTSNKSVFISKPLIEAHAYLNRSEEPELAINKSTRITGSVTFSNNMPDVFANAQVTVRLSGSAFDPSTVDLSSGSYRSVEGVMYWDRRWMPEMALMQPGKNIPLDFVFISKNTSSIINPVIDMHITVKGNRLLAGGQSEEVSMVIERKIKINTELALTSRTVYSTGPFPNKGPVPPKVEQKTTYTILWSLTNTSNNTSDTKVSTKLPPYVHWTGVTSASGEISYNQETGEVVWRPGTIPARTGFATKPKEIAFQVELEPAVYHVGEPPELTEKIVVTGKDTFTGVTVETAVSAATTDLPTDPRFGYDAGKVTQ